VSSRQRTALVSVAAAACLVALKLGVGVVAGSLALVSAGIESSGDVVAALLTLVAVRVGARPADRSHPYGHGRAENLSALGEAMILVGGAVFIAVAGVHRLTAGPAAPQAPWYAFAVIAAALMIDITRTAVSLRTARVQRSSALRANAFHFGGDLVGSLAVLAGLGLVAAGMPRADAAAALFVAVLILAAAVRLVWENSQAVMDRAPAGADRAARRAIEELDLPVRLRRLRLREAAGRHFADVVVSVPPAAGVGQGHAAADAVEAAVQRALPGSDVVVHIEPGSEARLRERALAAALSVPGVREAHDVEVLRLTDHLEVSLHIKLPHDMALREAHRAAGLVEAAITAQVPLAQAVHTHIEPLSEPARAWSVPRGRRGALEEVVAEIVAARDGVALGALRVVQTTPGAVVLLTVVVASGMALDEAHRVASELEEAIRAGAGGIEDVVVHTEPSGGASPVRR
jgi:cation diffusion facilitator family transporter